MNEATVKTPIGAVPAPIAKKLSELLARVRRMIIIRGACATGAVWLISLLTAMALDAGLTLFSSLARWGLALLVYGATGVAFLWFLIRPLHRTFTMAGIARLLETRHPELQERISSAVELSISRDSEGIKGSAALIAALVAEAERDVTGVEVKREIDWSAARPYILAAGITVFLLLAALAIRPAQSARLVLRTTAPFLNLPNIHADDVEVSPGDTLVCEGQTLNVLVRVANPAVTEAEILVSEPGGAETASRMQSRPGGNGRYGFLCHPAGRPFRYRIRAGDAVSRYYAVDVTPRPAIVHLDLRYSYPDYTREVPFAARVTPGDIRAVAGTSIAVDAALNKPVVSAELLMDGKPVSNAVVLATGDGGTPVCRFTLNLTPRLVARWSLRLKDQHGFENEPAEHLVIGGPDAAPVVRVVQPQKKTLKMNPQDRLRVAYAVADDYGLKALTLEVDAGKRLPAVNLLPDTNADSPIRQFTNVWTLKLADYDLTAVQRLAFQIRADDNLPRERQGPQHGQSDTFVIILDRGAESLRLQELAEQEKALRDRLSAARAKLAEARKGLAQLKEPLVRKPEIDETIRRRMDELRRQMMEAAISAQDASERMREGLYAGQAGRLDSPVREGLQKAVAGSGRALLTDTPAEREPLLLQADEGAGKSLAEIDKLLADLNDVTRSLHRAIETAELAERQAELADARRDLDRAAPGREKSPSALDTWRREQGDLARDFAGLVRQSDDWRRAALAGNQRRSEELAGRARELASEYEHIDKEKQRIAQIRGAQDQLKKLMEKQDGLASAARASLLNTELTRPMTGAAEEMKAGLLAGSLQQLARAETVLAQARGEYAQQAAASQLADGLEALARQVPPDRTGVAGKTPEATRRTAPAGSDALRNPEQLARELERLAAVAREATPLAQKAFRLHDPRESLRKLAGGEGNTTDSAARTAGQLQELATAARAAELAGRAEQIARQQREIARRAEEARAGREAAGAAAASARKQAEQAGKRVRQLAAKLDDKQEDLMKRQERLAEQAGKLAQAAARTAPEVGGPAASAAAAAQAAAGNMKPGVPAETQVEQMQQALKAAAEVADQLAALPMHAIRQAEQTLAEGRKQAQENDGGRAPTAQLKLEQAKRAGEQETAKANTMKGLGTTFARLADEQKKIADEVRQMTMQAEPELKAAKASVDHANVERVKQMETMAKAEKEMAALAAPQEKALQQTAALRDELAQLMPQTRPPVTVSAPEKSPASPKGASPIPPSPPAMAAAEQAEQLAKALAEIAAPSQAPQQGAQPQPPRSGQPPSPQGAQPQPPQSGQPQSPQSGQPQSPQGAQPQSPQGGQPQPPQSGQPQAPQGPQPQSPKSGQPQSPQGAQPPSPQAGQQGSLPQKEPLKVPEGFSQSVPDTGFKQKQDPAAASQAQPPAPPPMPPGKQQPPSAGGLPIPAKTDPDSEQAPPAGIQKGPGGRSVPTTVNGTLPEGGMAPPIPMLPNKPLVPSPQMPQTPPPPPAGQTDEEEQKPIPAGSVQAGKPPKPLTEDDMKRIAARLAELTEKLAKTQEESRDAVIHAARNTTPSQEPGAKSASVKLAPADHDPADIPEDKGKQPTGPATAPGKKPGGVESGKPAIGGEGSLTGTQAPGGQEKSKGGEGSGAGGAAGKPSNKPSNGGNSPPKGTPSGMSPPGGSGQPPSGSSPAGGPPPAGGGMPPGGQPGQPGAQPAQSPGQPGPSTAGPTGAPGGPQSPSALPPAPVDFGQEARKVDAVLQQQAALRGEAAGLLAKQSETPGGLEERQQLGAGETESPETAQPDALLHSRAQNVAERTEDLAHEAGTVGQVVGEIVKGKPDRLKVADLAGKVSRTTAAAAQLARQWADKPVEETSMSARPAELARKLNEVAADLEKVSRAVPLSATPSTEPPTETEPTTDMMDNALQAMTLAGLSGETEDAMAAASMSAQAAQAAQGSAPSGGQGGGKPSSGTPGSMGSTGGGATGWSTSISDVELRRLGIQRSDWFQLPGELRDEILQGAAVEGPEDYRNLIKRYFQDVASRQQQEAAAKEGQ